MLQKNKSRDFESRRSIPLLFNRSLLNRKLYTPCGEYLFLSE